MSDPAKRLTDALERLPIVAILRGLTPPEAVPIGEVLLKHGVAILEVPLSHKDAITCVARLADAFGDRALIGAGTVLRRSQLEAIKDVGGQLIVSPHCDPALIETTVAYEMVAIPGFFTPTEGLCAIQAGAHALKWFPANGVSPTFFGAMRTILPPSPPVLAVGGIVAKNLQTYLQLGIDGFGVGSSLYKPGDTPEDVDAKATALLHALRGAQRSLAPPKDPTTPDPPP